jgi:hypothetical protein
MRDDLRDRGQQSRGAVFPNGLALIPDDQMTDRSELFWDHQRHILSSNRP